MASTNLYSDNDHTLTNVIVNAVAGDLAIRGDAGQTHFRIDGSPYIQQQGSTLYVRADEDCSLALPVETNLAINDVGGDAHISHIMGDIRIDNVGGDLAVRHAETCEVDNVGGDMVMQNAITFTADNVGGDLVVEEVEGHVGVDNVGGDCVVQHCEGGVFIDHVGGDLTLRDIEGPCHSENVGGDLTLDLAYDSEQEYDFTVGGAVYVHLNKDANVTFVLPDYIETLRLGDFPNKIIRQHGELWVQLGDGAAKVNIVTDAFSIIKINNQSATPEVAPEAVDSEEDKAYRRDILDQLSTGTISPDQAVELLSQQR